MVEKYVLYKNRISYKNIVGINDDDGLQGSPFWVTGFSLA